jgi:hypothetical protein
MMEAEFIIDNFVASGVQLEPVSCDVSRIVLVVKIDSGSLFTCGTLVVKGKIDVLILSDWFEPPFGDVFRSRVGSHSLWGWRYNL